MKMQIAIQPWQTPNFVRQVLPVGLKQDGFKEMPSIPLSEVPAETLDSMCNAFRAEIFSKAGKDDPAS